MSEFLPNSLYHLPEAARNLEGVLSSGTVTGSRDGTVTQFVVIEDGTACLDGQAVKRLENGLVLVSNIFPERPNSDREVPPSQAEVVLFLIATEHSANAHMTDINPVARWHRRGRQETQAPKRGLLRQRKLEKTQRKLASLGFSVGVSLNPPPLKEG
jgi:hypothetical protein